jgi:hypothetical protein
MRDNGPGARFTPVAVDHEPGETDPDNGARVLDSPDEAKPARALRCINFLAGVPYAVLTGDDGLARLILAVPKNPTDRDRQLDLADRLNELTADEPHRV